jgi:2',3'-cyclic-nucleotide 2'-phosphodiesterase (5'-nucleotidase family)
VPDDEVRGELVTEGSLAQRLAKTPADLTIVYGSEQKASLTTCGCPNRPRGSLARLGAYAHAVAAQSPAVVVDAGYWLEDAMGFDGQLRSDVALMDAWMAKGVASLGFDALNVSYSDVVGLAQLRASPDGMPAIPVVSANVTGPGIERWVIVERGGRRVGITGITPNGTTLGDAAGYTIGDPAAAGPVLDELAAQADVVVLLAYHAPDVARDLAKHHPGIDVVIDADQHRDFLEPARVGHAVWAFSHYETMRAGELRLSLADGAVRGALDRKIDLDPDMPDDPAIATIARQAKTAIDREQHRIYGP